MTWERGRQAVEQLIEQGDIERVPGSAELAGRLLDEARGHRASAIAIAPTDPPGSYQLAYDAARKAAAALLAVQGLRATSKGGHIAVEEVIREQFGGPAGVHAFRAFSRLRRRRKGSEYPDLDTPTMTPEDLREGIDVSGEILDAATKLLREGRLGEFS